MNWLKLFISIVLLSVLFWEPHLTLQNEQYRQYPATFPPAPTKLAAKEYDTAVAEIKTRNEQGDAWFRYRFALVGALIAALIGYLAKPDKRASTNDQTGEFRLRQLWQSNAAATVLALALMLSVDIDIHIAISTQITNQIGLWIADYVEPALASNTNSHSLRVASPASSAAAGFIPWEQFLRQNKQGMHTDFLYGFFFTPHGHFLTWALYLAYVTVCAHVISREPPQLHNEHRVLAQVGYVLVHFVLIAYALIAHVAPSAFQFVGLGVFSDPHCFAPIMCIPAIFLYLLNRPGGLFEHCK